MLTLPQLPTERPAAERFARAFVRALGFALALAGVLILTDRVARAFARALGGALSVLGLLALSANAAHAVTVSPTAVYITSKNPSALLTLINTGSRPEEIELSIGFGYPVSDSLGVLKVDIVDTAASGEPSLTSYLRVFPRRLVLQPGQRQVVRVMVAMPAGAADGEYWGRVLVKSRGGEPPIEQTQGSVKMQLSLETTFATAVFFQKGEVKTGIEVPSATAHRMGDSVQFTLDLKRAGNSAFLGRIRAELVDAKGATVAQVEDVVAVYRTLRRRFVLRTGKPLPPGAYTVRYLVDTERPDLPPQGPTKVAEAVRGTVEAH
jgi:P pilus assembly chaperone PapD